MVYDLGLVDFDQPIFEMTPWFKPFTKLSLFSCPQLVGRNLQKARSVLQCNNQKLHVI